MQQPAKYLVYRLPAESLLIGLECTLGRLFLRRCLSFTDPVAGVICLEEFVKGKSISWQCNQIQRFQLVVV